MSPVICFRSYLSPSLILPICVPAGLFLQRIIAVRGHHTSHTGALCPSGWACLEQGCLVFSSCSAYSCHEAWAQLSGSHNTQGRRKRYPVQGIFSTQCTVYAVGHPFDQMLIILATVIFLLTSQPLTPPPRTPSSSDRETVKAHR